MFNQIVLVDRTGLEEWAIEKLQKYSLQKLVIYDDYPQNKAEILDRISEADCVLVSWNTQLHKNILQQCPQLKYVGMCCSLYDEKSANVDIAFAKANHIVVKGVRDYGDEGLIEFILAEIIRLAKGLGAYQWKDDPVELGGKKLGIIGLGTTGQMLADRAMAFNMEVYYYSRNRKEDQEQKGIHYLTLPELLQKTEILSIHLPKHTTILHKEEFDLFGQGKILINTSLGLTFDWKSFQEWIKPPNNFAIFDRDGVGDHGEEIRQLEGVMATAIVSGWTKEARGRLSTKVLDNITTYLEKSSK